MDLFQKIEKVEELKKKYGFAGCQIIKNLIYKDKEFKENIFKFLDLSKDDRKIFEEIILILEEK